MLVGMLEHHLDDAVVLLDKTKNFVPISGFLFSDNFSPQIKYYQIGTIVYCYWVTKKLLSQDPNVTLNHAALQYCSSVCSRNEKCTLFRITQLGKIFSEIDWLTIDPKKIKWVFTITNNAICKTFKLQNQNGMPSSNKQKSNPISASPCVNWSCYRWTEKFLSHLCQTLQHCSDVCTNSNSLIVL